MTRKLLATKPQYSADTVHHNKLGRSQNIRLALASQTFSGATTNTLIQPKLRIAAPNDSFEQEADRVSDQVMSMSETGSEKNQSPSLQQNAAGLQPQSQSLPLRSSPIANTLSEMVQRQEEAGEEEGKEFAVHAKSRGHTPEVTAHFINGLRSLRGGGQSLSPSARHFFEPRIGYDFSTVRIHSDSRASSLASKINARAFTLGSDIVFGARQYQPDSQGGRRLIAHELTHFLQQNPSDNPATSSVQQRISRGAKVFHIQRSPLSDSVRATHTADPSLEALLGRLAQSDIQAAQNDADVDAELLRILAGQPDDLWVAQQIRQGQLIETSFGINPRSASGRPRPVRAHFFPGTSTRRALVVAGVHGSEVQGVEVANQLVSDLQTGLSATPPQRPLFSVIVVPSLFPDNVAARRRQRSTQTNRNLPDPGQTLATAPTNAAGRPLAAPATTANNPAGTPSARPILDENIMLMALMERFRPERIISIHGTRRPGAAGVFADPRRLNQAEQNSVQGCATLLGTQPMVGIMLPLDVRQSMCEQAMISSVQQNDHDLALAAARAIDTSTSSITGREHRSFNRAGESGAIPSAQQTARESHPSVAGNIGTSGSLDTTHWSGVSPAGTSLGDYASAGGMSIYTVEPPLNCKTSDYAPGGTCSGRAAAVSQAERSTELMSYAEAIRTVLLGR